MLTATIELAGANAGAGREPGRPRLGHGRAFNLVVDQQLGAVAFPLDESDVVAAVAFARSRGLRIAPQTTGHNSGPLGSLDDTILVNTSNLVGVSIDPGSRRVRAGAGTRWRDVVPQLSELALAALHGSSPSVGIVGYSLGGGLGWLKPP
jgi:FAD/FMN-containing dehydrogenase